MEINIPDYVYINLRAFGNCLMPTKLCKKTDLQKIEKQLTSELGGDVTIEFNGLHYIGHLERVMYEN